MSTWEIDGATALATYAPQASAAFARVVEIRPIGVRDEMLEDPEVAAFAEQFAADVAGIDDDLRARLAEATGDDIVAVVSMIWIADVGARLRAALDALFARSQWETPRRYPVTDTGVVVDELIAAVSRLDGLDPILTELIRLRGARQHDCRICASRRSQAALDEGADEAMFDKVDEHATSDLPEAAKAALALVDAMIWSPEAIEPDVVEAVRRELSPAQAVELVLDVARNAADKVAVARGADAPEVTDGVQRFTTDIDGAVVTI